MSHDGHHSLLVLGGIRSGKSEFAEALVADADDVRYIATAPVPDESDEEWSARISRHQARRPAHWLTDEIGTAEPADFDVDRLAMLIAEAKPSDTLLVDDLGGWLTGVLGAAAGPFEAGWTAQAAQEPVAALVAAISGCAGRLIIVSPEVGLSVVPATVPGRAFADAAGTANRAIAAVVDSVVLVIAGQPTWLKDSTAPTAAGSPVSPVVVPLAASAAALVAQAPTSAPRLVVPEDEPAFTPATVAGTGRAGSVLVTRDARTTDVPEIGQGLMLPLPDELAAAAATERLYQLDVPGAGLGQLAQAVVFAAGAKGNANPGPYQSVRVFLLHGEHLGGVAAGRNPGDWDREVDRVRNGDGPIGLLAASTSASVQVVNTTGMPAAPIEETDAADVKTVQAGLEHGWRLADSAIDAGTDLVVLAAAGPGQATAAAAVVAGMVNTDLAALLPRVYTGSGQIDDAAWMIRCAALRDALSRVRSRVLGPKERLAALGGYDLAVAAGIVLGAGYRRTPVLLDGPVGIAASLIARDLASQSRLWLMLADDGRHPTVRPAALVLGLKPVTDLALGLGEGGGALAVLPLLQQALLLATVPSGPTE